MDRNEPIHQRTLMDHQNFQLRDGARINARAIAKSLEPNALQVGVVMEVSPAGFVMLDDFSGEDGSGEWMSVLSRNFPRVGDIAVYAMVKGAPVVLGTIGSEYDPARISGPNYTYDCEHFQTYTLPGASAASQALGYKGLFFFSNATTISPVTTSGIGTPSQGNGWVLMTTGSVLGNYGYISTGISNMSFHTVSSFEAGIYVPSTASEFISLGITDGPVSTPTNGLVMTYDTGVGGNWTVQARNAGVDPFSGFIDTGIAPVSGRLICIRFTKLAPGVWEIHYRVPESSEEPMSIGVYEGMPLDGSVRLSIALYNRAALARTLYVDYMAWSIEGIAGVF
jgi:hypothetical protein